MTIRGRHVEALGGRLMTGDVALVLAGHPEGSVDCVVTSPPYWGHRDYGVSAQLGGEASVEDYATSLAVAFDEVARLLTPRGTVWINLGDSFGGSWGNYVATGSDAATSFARLAQGHGVHRPPQSSHRQKDLAGAPWRTVFAMQSRGWLLRRAVVWHKPNARPESVRDRFAQRYEWVFLLARSCDHWSFAREDLVSDVWRVSGDRGNTGHPAAGTVEIARRCICLGCPPGGVVLDPFSGSGTTGVAALELGRGYLGVDVDPRWEGVAASRLAKARLR